VSDIHGNTWALDAVLAELEGARVEHVLNLGDCFSGPLDPLGTVERLTKYGWPTVRGNQDREILEGFAGTATAASTLRQVGEHGARWLEHNSRPTVQLGAVLACHGVLERDDVPLLEHIEPNRVRPATNAELAAALARSGEGVELVLCGHSHQQGTLRLADGRLVVNPGSVGLPAYTDDHPHPHAMEAGTPHARWAILTRSEAGWHFEFHATPYDTAAAVAAARSNGRDDWARWLDTGRAES
jgi:predicted phosphodiesterase